MINLSNIFFPKRNDNSIVHKFIPDRTIDRGKLIIVFFQNREGDFWAAAGGNFGQEYETMSKNLVQLREVADLLDIHVIENIQEYHINLSEQIIRLGITHQQVLFLAVTQLDDRLVKEINNLINSGFQVIIGSCGSFISKDEWNSYREVGNGDESSYRWHSFDKGDGTLFDKPNRKRVVMITAQDLIDVLLWEEFRMEFRQSHLSYSLFPCITDIVIPSLRQLEIGEPQLRLNFREGKDGKYVNEFALSDDWEPSETSSVNLVFRRPIFDKHNFWERVLRKPEKVYRYCLMGPWDYLCLEIFHDKYLCCCLSTISKDPKKNVSEILEEGKQIKQKSERAEIDFLKQNIETVLLIGEIGAKSGDMIPYRRLSSQEWDDYHIREALRVSIVMIGHSIPSFINPFADARVNLLSERLYKKNQ